ncbi:ferritin-like domain-containing protein [Alkalihalophilus marmarensis]|uniref:ferritin-like domain-containing protein n=1 Tax=Alkalihalophilus marmarensis TaxID=521377 RepID=UPI002DC00073|nr:ferritin-like protein [Alkalihalophilus marmarensis]MEC2074270.1 ferritin-like protein [Alkalihalophilus marmarensis]
MIKLQNKPPKIENLNELKKYLQMALKVELTTIPPYLLAMYSLKCKSTHVTETIRTVVVEEMLHMTLVANILNAIGETPDLSEYNIPKYPQETPIEEENGLLVMHLCSFSSKALDIFLAIEKSTPRSEINDFVQRDVNFRSLAEFYHNIKLALIYFTGTYGEEKIFCGDIKNQISKEHYYQGGGEIVTVKNLTTAIEALNKLVEQSDSEEEITMGKNHFEEEVSHYERFLDIKMNYLEEVQTYKILPHTSKDYKEYFKKASLLSLEFNKKYTRLIKLLQDAFSGEQAKLIEGISLMLALKNEAQNLLNMVIELSNGEIYSAFPTFEYISEGY